MKVKQLIEYVKSESNDCPKDIFTIESLKFMLEKKLTNDGYTRVLKKILSCYEDGDKNENKRSD